MTDENTSDDDDTFESDAAEFGTESRQPFTGGGMGFLQAMMDGTSFSASVDESPSEELALAIRLMKSGDALADAAEFLDERDIDISELGPMMSSLDRGESQVIFAISAMAGSLEKFSKQVSDGDDGDNPFKVSDGDDPVY